MYSENKSITKFILLLFFIPIVFHLLFEFFKSKNISSYLFVVAILFALFIIIFMTIVVNRVFSDMDNSFVDKEFILIFNIFLWILFVIRYILALFISGMSVFNGQDVPIYATSSLIIIFIPFVQNYNLNKKTIFSTIITGFLNMYILIPIIMMLVSKVVKNDYAITKGVCNSCFNGNEMVVSLMIYIKDLTGVKLVGNSVHICQAICCMIIYIVMFVPYIILDIYYIDKRTYQEKAKFQKMSKYIVFAVIFTVIWLVSLFAGSKLNYNISSDLLHY